jgi:hypothetical protein
MGEVIGHLGYLLSSENTLTFTVPLAALHDDDGLFYYTFDFYSPSPYSIHHGYRGSDYVQMFVPELSTYAMLLAGLRHLNYPYRRQRSQPVARQLA